MDATHLPNTRPASGCWVTTPPPSPWPLRLDIPRCSSSTSVASSLDEGGILGLSRREQKPVGEWKVKGISGRYQDNQANGRKPNACKCKELLTWHPGSKPTTHGECREGQLDHLVDGKRCILQNDSDPLFLLVSFQARYIETPCIGRT